MDFNILVFWTFVFSQFHCIDTQAIDGDVCKHQNNEYNYIMTVMRKTHAECMANREILQNQVKELKNQQRDEWTENQLKNLKDKQFKESMEQQLKELKDQFESYRISTHERQIIKALEHSTSDNFGRDFLLTFPEPYGIATKTQINIVGLIGTAVTISSPIAGVNRTVRVNPATGLSIDLPPTLIQRVEGKGNKYVRVESDFDISVAALTFVPDHTADGYLAIPSSLLGTLYFFYGSGIALLSLLALNDDTHVTVTFNAKKYATYANGTKVKSLSLLLSSFELYQVRCPSWCAGYINSSSSLSVRFGTIGYNGSTTPYDTSYIEEAVQVNDSSLIFIVPVFNSSSNIVLCVFTSGMKIDTDHEYDNDNYSLWLSNISSTKYIKTNQTCSCTYDGHGFSTIIPPVQSYTNFYRFLTPSLPNFSHHAAIMVLSSEKSGIKLDNSSPNAREETVSVHSQLYSVLYLDVSSGQHDITHENPSLNFGVILYGFKVDGNGSYAYPGGWKFD